MNYLSVEYLIVYAFLGITALVGLGGLRMKAVSGDFREYATANKRLGVGALAMTLLATFTGAWNTLVFTTEVWEIDFEAIIRMFLFLVIPAFSLTTFFIAPKIGRGKLEDAG